MGKLVDKVISNETSNLSIAMTLFVIITSALLYILDWTNTWNGYPLETLTSGLKLLLTIMSIIFAILFILNHFKPYVNGAFFLYSLWAFIFLGGLAIGNVVSLVHLLFSMILFFIFKNIANDFENLSKAIFIITFMDFFGFALLKLFVIKFGVQNPAVFSRLMIPLWLYYVLGFCQKHNGTALVDWLLIGLVLFNMFMIVDIGQLTVLQRTDNLDKSWTNQALAGMKGAWTFFSVDLWLNLGQSYHDFNQDVFNQSYLYDGQQEETENPQGIYIETIERGDYLFKAQSPVYLWAILEGRTLETPIEKAIITCTIDMDDGSVKKGIVNEEAEEYVIEGIYTGMDRTISCRFNDLDEGNYRASFNVDFDFGVDARTKIYLMDRTRYTEELVALKRQGSQPSSEEILRSVGITDTTPETIYTSGPVSMGIGRHNSPWDIGDQFNIKYLFGVTIENMWSGGEIQSINEIQFIVPETFEIMFGSCDIKLDYDNPKIIDGSKVYTSTESLEDLNIQALRTVNCLMKVEKDSLDPVKVTTRFLKAHADYSYLMTEELSFEVEGLSDFEKQVIEKDMICCEIISSGGGSSTVSYQKLSSYDCQNINDDVHKFTKVADDADNCVEMFDQCCEISGTGPDNYIWVVDEIACDEYEEDGIHSARLISETSKCPTK